MNTYKRLVSITALIATLGLLTFTGCSKADRTDVKDTAKDALATTKDTVKDAYAATKDALSDSWDSVTAFTFDKRDGFNAHVDVMTAKLDAQLSEARADYSEAKATASRKAAMAELKDSEADYRDKAAALGKATADTWDSAKKNVIASWDRVQASYKKARAN